MTNQIERLSQLQKRDRNLRFRTDPSLGIVRHLRGDLDRVAPNQLRAKAAAFLEQNQALFGDVAAENLQVLTDSVDRDGGQDVVLQQYHGRHRVYGGSIRLHASREGVVDTVSNALFPDLANVPLEPRVSQEKAIRVAQDAIKLSAPPDAEPELLVYRYENKPRLCWWLRIPDKRLGDRGRPAQWVSIVDATTGKLLVQYDDIKTVGPIVAQGTGYYSGPGTVNAWDNGSTFQLRDTTRAGGPEIITGDEDGASPSEDTDQNWNDGTLVPRDANQGAEVDAHRYAGAVVDYFSVVHGRNSYNGAGGNVNILSHYGSNYSNGFWDGAGIKLGDGTGVAATGDDYECSDDWLAHELTHAYTQYTCALQYLNESGALNESFSDVFAAFITGDWVVFEDAWLKASAPGWRNMIDPTNGGMWDNSSLANAQASVFAGHGPSHYSQRFTFAWDNGGVHVNSGIINHLFYLLTIGGTHAISGVAVTGIGQAAAEQMLFRCMTVNLVGKPNATFLDFREAMVDACLDLFPTDLEKLTQVKNAFNAVGIGPDLYVRDNLADTGLEPYGGTYLYASPDIINRQTASASPMTDFADLTNDALWENIESGQPNFIYIRLQNRGPQSGDATVNVYLIPATSFGNPAGWIHIGTAAPIVGLAPGAMTIAQLTLPAVLIPGLGHYCMCAVVTSSLDPAPDTSLIASVSDYINYVRNTNNIAYRNMDVVDLVPGHPGHAEFEVVPFGDMAQKFDLRFKIDELPPGLKLRIVVPAKRVGGTRMRGLKLVARGENDVFVPLEGRELRRELAFLRLQPQQRAVGLDNVMLGKPFKVRVEWELPDNAPLVVVGPKRTSGIFAMQQLFRGEEIGQVGLRFRVKKPIRRQVAAIDKPGPEKIALRTKKK